MESETWEDRFNALLCEYLNDKFDLNAVRITSTYTIDRAGCDTCDYGSFYGTGVHYIHVDGSLCHETLEVDLNELIG